MISIKYLAWSAFFIFQGRVIDWAIQRNMSVKALGYALLSFVCIKLLMMLCDLLQKFIPDWYTNLDLKLQWEQYFPNTIYSDNQLYKNELQVLFFDYIPRFYELKVGLIINRTIMICVAAITILSFFYHKLYWGVLILMGIFTLNYLSKYVFVSKLDRCQHAVYEDKMKLYNWISQYFLAYREISKNWQLRCSREWVNSIYSHYFSSKKELSVAVVCRDLLLQVLVELPFLFNTVVVILAVYYQTISITQLFIWIGFSQFMIQASNAYFESKSAQIDLNQLNNRIGHVLQLFQDNIQTKKLMYSTKSSALSMNMPIMVSMLDGSVNHLSVEPGVYLIQGANGSGKSTLLNQIMRYERGDFFYKNKGLEHINAIDLLKKMIHDKQIRVIDRNSILFDCFEDFSQQICGPKLIKKESGESLGEDWTVLIMRTLQQLVSRDLVDKWMKIFLLLETHFYRRKNREFSSGEKVLISLMRFLSGWHNGVKLLIIDECEAFLDGSKKPLFRKTITEISAFMAVFVCHHND